MWIEPEHHEWRWVALLLVLTAVVASLPFLARHPSRNLVEDAFIYAQPSKRGIILGMVKKGVHVHVLGKINGINGSWIKIRDDKDDQIGWVTAEAADE
ncbi:MAG TPA: SH3 domain-containing protein [Bacillota bacterium]|jgi:hypothetical protein|nr:SH3 domain-containing protein [Bacillota bacterium]